MEISVLTYNIHKAIGNDRSYQPGRIVEILRESSADILCLQEVDFQVPRSHNDDLARKLAEALEMEYDLGLNVQLKKGAYGNATLSRFPIVHTENLGMDIAHANSGRYYLAVYLPKGMETASMWGRFIAIKDGDDS